MVSVVRHEFSISRPARPQLFLQSWKTENGPSRGTLIITHGFCEHSECYNPLATNLAENGWNVIGWDLQGHGKSEGKRGYIGNFGHYCNDLRYVVGEIKESSQFPSDPLVLFGHSMGGLITLRYLLEENLPQLDGVILSSPALGLKKKVPAIKDSASRWLDKFWPTLTLNAEIHFEELSRDSKMVASFGRDPLRHDRISPAVYLGMLENMEYAKDNIERLKVPVLMQLAGQDKITDSHESLTLFKDIHCEKSIHIYEDSFHEIYNDINRNEVIAHLHEFLKDQGL